MDNRSLIPIWFALAANIFVAAATFAVHGWTAAATHAAARNTARFASLCFLLAFAAPGLTRWFPGLRSQGRLIHAYVAAHLVHFAVVGVLLLVFESAHLVQAPGKSSAVVLIGAAVVLTAGITARLRPSRLYNGVHAFAMYAIFAIFLLAFAHNPVKSLRVVAVLLGLALAVRLTSKLPHASVARRAKST